MISLDVKKAVIYVYSMDFALKGDILDRNGMEITAVLSYGKCDMIRSNDPVVFMYFNKEHFECVSGVVTSTDYKTCTVKIYLAEDFNNEERRVFERYPVSMEASARKKYQNRRVNLYTKNMSLYGMGVTSATEIDLEEQLDIDLITKKNMFYFSAKIVWKKRVESKEPYYEYGIHITDIDVSTLNSLDEYLKKLRAGYTEMYEKAR